MDKRLVLAVTASLVIGAGLPALGQEPSASPEAPDLGAVTTAVPSPADTPTDMAMDSTDGSEGVAVAEESSPAGVKTSADAVNGTVGLYQTFDDPSDPSTLCAYPVDGTRLSQLMARGPRVDFPSSVGEVGWVTWQLLVQRQNDDGTWKTIARPKKSKRTVTVGFSMPFPTQLVAVPKGNGRVRLVGVLEWFDQGGHRAGKARHIVQHYGWDRYQFEPVASTDPISFDQIERTSVGSCPSRWSS